MNQTRVHDFDFLAGEWIISNRRLTQGDDWETFSGEATVYSVLDGLASIEELRLSPTTYMGMGVRVFDLARRVWADHWVGGSVGVVNPPMTGTFEDGVGTFLAEDVDDDGPYVARGVWDRITPTSCRWHQSSSRDGGETWEHNWFMDWTRAERE
jgi:hypothetical protein